MTRRILQALVVLLAVVLVLACVLVGRGEPPPLGWTTPVRLVRVIDGDTIEVEIRRTIHVRLLDCWAPESRTKNVKEKARGLACKLRMLDIVGDAPLVLSVPTNVDGDLTATLTLGRVLGHVWAGGEDVAATLRREGHAFATKAELMKTLDH